MQEMRAERPVTAKETGEGVGATTGSLAPLVGSTATTAAVAAGAGMLLSVFLADVVVRAELSALGAGTILQHLAPLFVVSCVFCGWSSGAECAGAPFEAVGPARWAEFVMAEAQGALMVATGATGLFQIFTGFSSFHISLQLAGVAALALPTACSFVMHRGLPMNRKRSECQHG